MTCKKSYIDSVRKLAIILFLLPAFIQAEVKENYFILDGEFDRYAKKKLQEHPLHFLIPSHTELLSISLLIF